MVAVMLGGLPGDYSNIDHKLVPVCREHGHSERNRDAIVIESGPENFNHRFTFIAWQVEKHRFVLIWRTDRPSSSYGRLYVLVAVAVGAVPED